ncbi:OprO/OprP family phosphate-selective porin [Dyella sp. C9]|uniref:OprO/OprP family phosphate-selective porin n=1 Tax=Dyella sp. C9 TaxID=2202154 RepID=UPI0013006944|nr:porin [Dyella sp. C9]
MGQREHEAPIYRAPSRLALALACAIVTGCVSQPPKPPAGTPSPTLPSPAPASSTQAPAADSTPPEGSPAAEALRRLSLMRPLEGGIDTPIIHTQIHGYLMVDAADYSSKGFGNTQFSVRRADINFQRQLWLDWLFYADSQLVDGHLEFKDIYVRKETSHFGVVTIGNQQEPFGLEQYGSFRNTTFLERATTSALAPSRSIGVTSSDFRGPWIWSYGLFTAGTRDEGRHQRGLALTGRLAYMLPTENGPYHLAVDYSTRRYGPDNDQRFDSAPEVALSNGVDFLDTGNIQGSNKVQRYGLEAAHVSGPFSWQSEYMEAHLQRDDGLPSLRFRGWYAYASFMLTGESRPYRESNAIFGPVVPSSPWNGHGGGALEVAVRLSRTNLNDDDVFGGQETNLSVGVNWYLDKSVRLSANLVHAIDLDKPGSDYDGKHPSAIVGRLQYQF